VGSDLLPFSEVTSAVAAVSVIGIFLLLPLYLSQRRDILRLKDWMEQAPDFPAADLAVSEDRLDRFERELAHIYAERGDPVPGTTEFQAVHPGMTMEETSERPALAQVTMERSALEPHPRWRRFAGQITQPRWLALIALVAFALGAAGIVVVDNILSEDTGSGEAASTAPSGIEVAVLNTTAADGLAGKVAGQIESAGYLRGEVGNITRETDQTVVMYEPNQKRAAMRVANELGGVAVQEIDRDVEQAAGGADVVVIIGQDRVG
jgi:hypothetical protein